jgi:hypothetical protein
MAPPASSETLPRYGFPNQTPNGEREMTYALWPGGRIVRSARSRSRRAISIGSSLRTSFAASNSTSCTALRISASMISTARSFCSRLTNPATRYQQFRRAFVGVHDG